MMYADILIMRHQFKDGHHSYYDIYWKFVRESMLDVVISSGITR